MTNGEERDATHCDAPDPLLGVQVTFKAGRGTSKGKVIGRNEDGSRLEIETAGGCRVWRTRENVRAVEG